MAKRFTETTKWKDTWYSDLTSKYKLFWNYLLDDCDHCGIWEVNFKVAQFLVGESLEHAEVKRVFKERIIELNDGAYWFIPKFIKFQYGETLSKKNQAVKKVIEKLESKDLFKFLPEIKVVECVSKDLQRSLQGPKEEEEDKEEDEVKLKDKEMYDLIFQLYASTLQRTPKLPELEKMGLLLKEYGYNTIKRTMKGIITELGWKCTVRQIEDVLKDPSKLNMYSKSDMVSYNWLLQQLNKDSSFDMTKYKPNKDKPKPDEEVWSLK